MDDKKETILRSEEVQDILSRPPHSLIRTGSSVICIIMLVLIAGCFFFKYPDIITCKATITKNNPPTWIIAKSTGKICKLFVADGEHIKKNQIIAVIENPAETKDMLELDAAINTLLISDNQEIHLDIKANSFGDVMEYYNSFIKAVEEYNSFIRNNLYDEKIRAEEKQLKPYTEYTRSAERQMMLGRRQNVLNEKNYNREKTLHEKELTSDADMETAEQELISGQMSIEQIKTSLANTKIQVAQIQNNISELKLQKEQERRQIATALTTAMESLKNAIRQWRQNYVLESPADGMVSYNNVWNENQNIAAGDKAFAIVMPGHSRMVAKAKIPASGNGKVHIGQHVNIKLDGYPYMEYGVLTGKIKSVSSMPDNGLYTASIDIDKKAVTSYGKRIMPDSEQTGIAEVITEDISIGERFLFPIKYLISNNMK